MPNYYEDEPVGYLEGNVDPYGSTEDDEVDGYLEGAAGYQDDAPAFRDDDEVDGYLEGAAGTSEEEELPALPGAEGSYETVSQESQDYTASDLLESSDGGYEDPYAADPYASSAEDQGGYEGYDAAAVEGDASYFDEMGHQSTEEPVSDEGYTSTESYEEAEVDQPKTISQQDAESIIRRITTKRIVPTEQEVRPVVPTGPSLTPTGGGLRVWPLVLAFLILGGAAVFLFRDQVGEFLDEQGYGDIAALIGWEKPPEVSLDPVAPVETEEARRRRLFKEMVLKGELKAFSITEQDLAPGAAPSAAASPTGGQ